MRKACVLPLVSLLLLLVCPLRVTHAQDTGVSDTSTNSDGGQGTSSPAAGGGGSDTGLSPTPAGTSPAFDTSPSPTDILVNDTSIDEGGSNFTTPDPPIGGITAANPDAGGEPPGVRRPHPTPRTPSLPGLLPEGHLRAVLRIATPRPAHPAGRRSQKICANSGLGLQGGFTFLTPAQLSRLQPLSKAAAVKYLKQAGTTCAGGQPATLRNVAAVAGCSQVVAGINYELRLATVLACGTTTTPVNLVASVLVPAVNRTPKVTKVSKVAPPR